MALSFKLTSTDFRGVVNRRFWANFFPFPASNQFYFEVGTPNFKLPDITHDREVELRSYRAKTPLVLAFTRIFTAKQYCPFCYPHLVELADRYAEFRALGFEVLLVTSVDRTQSQQVAQDLGLTMPLLSDPSCRVFRSYGVGQALGAPLPAQFLLDCEGKLRYRHLFSFLEPNAPIERLLDLAKPWGLKQLPAAPQTEPDTEPVAIDSATTTEVEGATSQDDRAEQQTDTVAGATKDESLPDEIVEPEIEPMPDISQAIAFAAGSTDSARVSQLETIEPELEPLPNLTAKVALKRRQSWLDETADAIEGEPIDDSPLLPSRFRRDRS